MSKSDLRARPTFHYKKERVLAHLLICICSLAVLREFERQIMLLNLDADVGLSIVLEEVLAIRKYTLRIPHQQDADVFSELTPVQERLMRLGVWGT